jgi:hypothetical protein
LNTSAASDGFEASNLLTTANCLTYRPDVEPRTKPTAEEENKKRGITIKPEQSAKQKIYS